jgi:hypothetical protein
MALEKPLALQFLDFTTLQIAPPEPQAFIGRTTIVPFLIPALTEILAVP